MNPERWSRLKTAFQGALDQPADARRAWLRQACGDEEELLRDAEALLNAHDTAGDFLEQPAQLDPADLDTLPAGTMLGSYRIGRELGRGGMGVVYLATDNLDRDVAIKTLPAALAADPTLRERLRREAKAAGNIKHHGVATIYLLDEIDGHLVIVSEFVQGDTLRMLLSRGGLDPARAHTIAVEIASALAAAHDARVVHRDLKPENVIITPAGRVKLVDFGIAHIEGSESARMTTPGMMLGTPAYMAPEQLAGGSVTPSTDIYSFGIVLGEMLTGQHPLLAGRSAAADRTLRRDLPHTSESNAVGRVPLSTDAMRGAPAIPPAMAPILARCVNVDPNERYASGRELLAALTTKAVAAAPSEEDGKTTAGSPRWWWEFHQAFIAALYWLMTWPAWKGRQIVGGPLGRALFIATLIAVIVAANLRLHLWFTSRFYPAELRWARRRVGLWIRLADWLFVASLAATGIIVGEDRSPVAIVLLAVAVGAAIAFLVIERATARAAFRTSTTPRV
jgi:serine/threonine-protein kinase